MSFKIGNIVRFKCGYWGERDEYQTGRLGVIEYSYGERYGNGEVYGGYCVLDREDGSSSAWWQEEYLEFVSDGGLDEIERCHEIYRGLTKRYQDLTYIKSKIIRGDEHLSATSILTLFHKIGFRSSFESNGEYICLQAEWVTLFPMFEALFLGDYDGMVEAINKVIKEEYRDEYVRRATAFFNEMNPDRAERKVDKVSGTKNLP